MQRENRSDPIGETLHRPCTIEPPCQPIASQNAQATLLQDYKQVQLTGTEVLRYAQQDPTWNRIPQRVSKEYLDTPQSRAYQINLMKETVEINQMYTAFYLRRLKEQHVLPFWWLNFEDDVSFFLLRPSPSHLLYMSMCNFVMLQGDL